MSEKINIAIVDDDSLVRQGIESLLKNQEDFEIKILASNGLELLENIKNFPINVVILDDEMPIMNGCDTLKLLKQWHPEIKVILLSSGIDEECVANSVREGAASLLTKDKGIEEIINAIRSVQKTGYYFHDDLSLMMAKLLKDSAHKKNEREDTFLTSRELEILQFISSGQSAKEIGAQLNLSPRTIEAYRKSMMNKTHSKNLMGLLNYAMQHNLIRKSA